MTFFKRMFSADFRRAVAAEAAGDYAEAARAYALAGERRQGRRDAPAARRARALPRAPSCTSCAPPSAGPSPTSAEGRNARRRIARALFNWARASAVVGDPEKQVVREAAQLFADIGDFAAAGECQRVRRRRVRRRRGLPEGRRRRAARERAGARGAPAQARHPRPRRRSRSTSWRWPPASAIARSRPSAAAPRRRCRRGKDVAELTRERASYQRLREELEAKLIADGSVIVRAGAVGHARERRYVGSFPLVMGRDADLPAGAARRRHLARSTPRSSRTTTAASSCATATRRTAPRSAACASPASCRCAGEGELRPRRIVRHPLRRRRATR